MKSSKFDRVALASVVSLGLGFGVIACGPTNTIDFLYVTSSSKNRPGQINVYKVDSQAGALIPIPNSPYPSGGRNPVAVVASANGKNLYVINHGEQHDRGIRDQAPTAGFTRRRPAVPQAPTRLS